MGHDPVASSIVWSTKTGMVAGVAAGSLSLVYNFVSR
jgi:hypothetical protein